MHATVAGPRYSASVSARLIDTGVLPTPPLTLAKVITAPSGSGRAIACCEPRSRTSRESDFGASLRPSIALIRPRTPSRAGSLDVGFARGADNCESTSNGPVIGPVIASAGRCTAGEGVGAAAGAGAACAGGVVA